MLSTLRHLSRFILLPLLAATATLAQTTIHVPGDKPTIQAGIDAAVDGDTVQVAAGTYYEHLVLTGKNITLTGVTPAAGQPPPTIIDGSSSGSVLMVGPGTSSVTNIASVISNFTIQNGGNFSSTNPTVAASGAVEVSNGCGSCSDIPPRILNNLITGSNCVGIEIAGSTYLAGNTISGTQDNGECGSAGGAGIQIIGDQYIALSGEDVPATIYGNIIEDNVQSAFTDAGSSGGAGIAIGGGEPTISSNIIRNNVSPGGTGAGINIFASFGHSGRSVAILQNIIYNNSAGCGGGAIATPTSRNDGQINVLIANNTLVNNTGDDSAGYMECAPISQIYPAPISGTDNDPSFLSGPDTVIVNNIIAGSTTDPAVDCTPLVPPSEAIQPLFDHNILYNGGGAFFGSFCVDVSTKYHNLAVNPGFDPNPALLYHPAPGSPAIDAGNNSVLAYIQQVSGMTLPVDAAGIPRLQDATARGYPVIDIGAYEYTPSGGVATENGPTTIAMTAYPYAGPANSSFALTAIIAAANLPTGSINFYSDNQPIGSAVISNGVAKETVPLPPGVHGVYATFDGTGNVAPAISLPIIIDVAKVSTSILLQSDAVSPPLEPSNYSVVGQSVVFTITSASVDGYTPSPVTLTNVSSNTALSAPITNFSDQGKATVTTTFTTPGRYSIEASYAGTGVYAAASDTITQTVTGYPTITALNCPASVPFGGSANLTATVTSSQGTPTGHVDFSDQGIDLGKPTLVSGSATVTYAPSVPGVRVLTASYPAQGAYAASSATCNVSVGPRDTLALTSSSPLINAIPTSPAYTPVTFTAALTSSDGLSGAYTLTIQGLPSVTMTPNAVGTTATYTTNSLAPGQYNVTATFKPADSAPSITAQLSPYQLITVPTGDFTLTGPSSVTSRTESSASGTLNLASIGSFEGTVALTCSLPLPATYTCNLSPASVPLAAGGAATVKVTLSPRARRAANESATTFFAALLPLTLLSLAGFVRRRRGSLLSLAMLAILATTTTACGKDIYYAATPPDSYPFTITATGTTKGATTPDTHTLNITLVLTP